MCAPNIAAGINPVRATLAVRMPRRRAARTLMVFLRTFAILLWDTLNRNLPLTAKSTPRFLACRASACAHQTELLMTLAAVPLSLASMTSLGVEMGSSACSSTALTRSAASRGAQSCNS